MPRGVRSRVAAVVAFVLLAPGSGCERPPPSILLFVSDTTRADAVRPESAPTVSALAAEGVHYTAAFSQAPWTLPSHVSIFSGMLPTAHGVGTRSLWAPDRIEMLAERMQERGYHTIGLSENPWISQDSNTDQGFESFTSLRQKSPAFPQELERALSTADDGRPLFVFVNVMNAHDPYRFTEGGPFTPPFLDPQEVDAAARRALKSICRPDADPRDQAVAWALYLDEITRVDRKLAITIEELKRRDPGHRWITVFTSDHGQLFGEHGLTGHQFSLNHELLHVPLVVYGLPGAAAAEVNEPVALVDLADTIVAWADGERDGLPGRGDSAIVSETVELRTLAEQDAKLRFAMVPRNRCDRSLPVFGDMRSLIQYPMKLIWYSDYPPALFDLATDPGEHTDLSHQRIDETRKMLRALTALTGSLERVTAEERPLGARDPKLVQRLKELGYLRESDSADPAAQDGSAR